MIGPIPITDPSPVVSCGRWPARAVVGEVITVSATVFREGHDAVGTNVAVTRPDGSAGPYTPMRSIGEGTDRYSAEISIDQEGDWSFAIEAWSDPVETWRHAIEVKAAAGQGLDEVAVDLEDGAQVLERALPGLPPTVQPALVHAIATLRDESLDDVHDRIAPALSRTLVAALHENPLRDLVTVEGPYKIWVDRERALYGSWYEFFPRSEGSSLDPPRSGTFATAAERLPAIADMGFDVVYLPPIHPVGEVNRKGPNNTLTPGPDDPGSPWAIGSRYGGHDAIHPELGTLEDFDAFVERARDLGLEVALDFALQAAPDHPWVQTHPQFFTTRLDGTIAYAENPPKKYQDIYPVNFDNDPVGICREVLRVVKLWMSHGVRIFRVDNPHTKPVAFWEWLLKEVRRTDPDVIFLSEAFTRPAMMHALGAVGFHQSYTYFTWRTAKWELEDYLRELSHQTDHVMRPNFFVNPPDILHAYLQYGGPAAFKIRAAVAATGSPSWGVYAGYELFEHVAVRPGSEEYLDSEKYQVRIRDWDTAEAEGRTLSPYLTRLNGIRRAHPALQQLRNLTLHNSESDAVLAFSKSAVDPTTGEEEQVLVVVNVDPHGTRETMVHLNMPELGMDWTDAFTVHDELTGNTWTWGEHNYVRLDPYVEPAHILIVRRPAHP